MNTKKFILLLVVFVILPISVVACGTGGLAASIEQEDALSTLVVIGSSTPEPTLAPTSTETPKPTYTATNTSTSTPVPTDTVNPTNTPTPTPMPTMVGSLYIIATDGNVFEPFTLNIVPNEIPQLIFYVSRLPESFNQEIKVTFRGADALSSWKDNYDLIVRSFLSQSSLEYNDRGWVWVGYPKLGFEEVGVYFEVVLYDLKPGTYVFTYTFETSGYQAYSRALEIIVPSP